MKPRLAAPLSITAVLSIVFLYSACDGTGKLAFDPRNISLSQELSQCATYGEVAGDVRVGYTLGGDVTFDLEDIKGSARKIDPVHLVLQFASKIRGYSYGYLILASGGTAKFRIPKSKADKLGMEYDLDARGWALNHIAEFAETPEGRNPFGPWTGGLLGVLTKQMEDLGDLMNQWYRDAH